MMPLSDMAALLVTSLLRLLGAAITVLFGLGYIGQITGQRWLTARRARWGFGLLGIVITISSSHVVKFVLGN